MRLLAHPVVLAATLVVAAGCSGDDGGHDGATDANEPVNCATVVDDDEFVVGLTKAGSSARYDFALMGADPAPPSRGDNAWQLELTAAGAPQADAAISVFPFMPTHGHTSPTAVKITPGATPGRYELASVNFWMPGVWEVTIDATVGGVTDTALFRFCIAS